MGLKIFINGINLHTGRLPMAVSSGLKRSQRVSKCHETLGAEHIRASHMVSKCNETLGAEHIRASHRVSKCRETLGAEPIRASHKVSKGHEMLGAEHIRASHMVSQCPNFRSGEAMYGSGKKSFTWPKPFTLGLEAQEVAHRHGVGTPKADNTTRTLMKTP